jgi:hypothetical protein
MNNLDLLIQDCLKTYADDYIPSAANTSSSQSTLSDRIIDNDFSQEQKISFNTILASPVSSTVTIPSPVQSPQRYKFSDIQLVFPEQDLFNFKSMDMVSPVSPVETPNTRARFNCSECSNSYLGSRQLLRHLQKHNEPDKYSCTVVGCKIKNYRVDGMRSHIKSHQRRIERNIEDTSARSWLD